METIIRFSLVDDCKATDFSLEYVYPSSVFIKMRFHNTLAMINKKNLAKRAKRPLPII